MICDVCKSCGQKFSLCCKRQRRAEKGVVVGLGNGAGRTSTVKLFIKARTQSKSFIWFENHLNHSWSFMVIPGETARRVLTIQNKKAPGVWSVMICSDRKTTLMHSLCFFFSETKSEFLQGSVCDYLCM